MYAALSLGFILLTTAIVFISQPWVITAVPIGFLFGFFMQKGDLCGASAFSEVLLEKEIERVKELEDLAREVVRSGEDAKWNQLNTILDDLLMIYEPGPHRARGVPLRRRRRARPD